MDNDQRRFQRIPFDAHIQLTLSSDQSLTVTGSLQDISLKGALIELEETAHPLSKGAQGELKIQTEQGEVEMTMNVEVAYVLESKRLYGFNLISVDIESAGHLRRLVEVNLGNDSILQRELANLIDAMESEHDD